MWLDPDGLAYNYLGGRTPNMDGIQMPYRITKRYGHEEGWSCTFRQWRAEDSHCRYIHGYALAVEISFECEVLDERGWCLDFGGLKDLKAWLKSIFDHKLLIAEDDPQLERLKELEAAGLTEIVIVPGVSCERFAEMIAEHVFDKLAVDERPRVRLQEVKVFEHQGNSATYTPPE